MKLDLDMAFNLALLVFYTVLVAVIGSLATTVFAIVWVAGRIRIETHHALSTAV